MVFRVFDNWILQLFVLPDSLPCRCPDRADDCTQSPFYWYT